MSFMQPQIIHGKWIVIEVQSGTEIVPRDAMPESWDHTNPDAAEQLSMFLSDHRVLSISIRTAWGARLSAPGYLDCTDWFIDDSREWVEQTLHDMYDIESDEEAEA
jgi:hypothetical protein